MLLRVLPLAQWYEYEPISHDNEREGSILAFGSAYHTHFRFHHGPPGQLNRECRIVCLDCDLLGSHPSSLRLARPFRPYRWRVLLRRLPKTHPASDTVSVR